MREYEISYYTKVTGGKGVIYLFAKDRPDAIKAFKKIYKKSKVMSARLNKAVSTPEVAPEPEPILTEKEVFQQMLNKAWAAFTGAPFSGVAIGRYLKLLLTSNPPSSDLLRAVRAIVVTVDNYNEKLADKRKR